jgi:hypothetical protein
MAGEISCGAGHRSRITDTIDLCQDAISDAFGLALARCIPRTDGAWWSPATFEGGKRSGDTWRASSAIVLDIDHREAHASERGRAPWRHMLALARALRNAPCTWWHFTKRGGARLVVVLDRTLTDRSAHRRAADAAMERAKLWLEVSSIERIYELDAAASRDAARLWWAPPIGVRIHGSGRTFKLDELRAERKSERKATNGSHRSTVRHRVWIEAAIEGESREIAGAAEGTRNERLNRSAYVLHRKAIRVGLEGLERDEIDARLADGALHAGLPSTEIEATLRSARAAADRDGPWEGSGPDDRANGVTPSRSNWRELLILGQHKDGTKYVLPVPANVSTILRYHEAWSGIIAYDAFAESIITTNVPPWDKLDAPQHPRAGEWTDTDTVRLVNWLQRHEGLKVAVESVEHAVSSAAETNVVHPVRDYLRGVYWDGTERIDRVLIDYFGAEDNYYVRAIGKRWMISAVARVFSPGCQVDCTLILEGPQGAGKTSGLRALVPKPEWYADTGINIGDKDSYQNLRGVWIYGLDELDSLRRSDVTRVKTFLSQTSDRYRESYGRRARSFQRQNVFVGTTNESEYLIDRTGNRRFWPVKVGSVNIQAIVRDRDQLWAEARTRFERQESWHVDTLELRAACEREQTDRVQTDPWVEIIAAWLLRPRSGPNADPPLSPIDISRGVTTTEVLLHAIEKPAGQMTRMDHMRASEVLRELGYVHKRRPRESGTRAWRYSKI